MNDLPDLDRIFLEDDGADHADDSCCLSLAHEFLPDDEAKWAEVRDQHLAALQVLASQAVHVQDERDGWWLARPLVFAAHHAAELVLKTATISQRERWPAGADGHSLVLLMRLDRDVNGERISASWEDELVLQLANAWEAGRYPTTRRGEPLFDDWCCVSAGALCNAVVAFSVVVREHP